MTRLDDIKAAISGLTDEDRARLREWLAALEANKFDERIIQDALAGRLDQLADAAIADHRAGRTRRL
jgi:uncharacterized protein